MSEHELGEVVSIHPWVGERERRVMRRLSLGAVVAIIAFLKKLTAFYLVMVPCTLAVAAVAGLAWLAYARRHRGRVVTLHSAGFAVDRGERRVVRWDDVTSVTASQVTTMEFRFGYKELDRDVMPRGRWEVRIGTELVLTIDERWEGYQQLSKAASDAIAVRQLPGAKASFTRGEPLVYGPLTFDRNGIRRGQLSLAWNDVDAVQIVQGMLVVTRKPRGRFAAVDVAQIPNVATLVPFAAWAADHVKETARAA